MTHRLGLRALATSIVVLAAVSACSNRATPTSEPGSSVTPSTGGATSPTARAATDATATLRRYFSVLDGVRSNRSAPVGHLASVTIGTQLATEKNLVASERAHDYRQTGLTKLDKVTIQSVNLDNTDPATGEAPTVLIDVCWDVSGADLVDSAGRSVVSQTRRLRGWTRYTVTNYHWSADRSGGWRVASSQDLKQAPCAAS